MVFPGFSLSLSFPCFYSFLSCSAFFSLSCSALSRTSTDTRHNLTICTQKATRFNKGPRRSRCCGQASYSLSCSALFFFLSCSALSRTSMAPRNALRLPEDDNENTRHLLTICTQKATRFNKNSRRSRCCGQAGYSLRASTKIRTAAGVAVKLATACKTTKKTRCFFTKAAAFSRLTKFIRLSDRSEPEFDASVHSRAVVRG